MTDTIIKQMTFGMCKNCFINEAIYSNKTCETCHKAKADVVRKLIDRGVEPGTKPFIEQLQLNGVYY